MKAFRTLSLFAALVCALLTACITEDVPPNTRRGNFDALWQTLDARYCFFREKGEIYGLDWNEVRSRYLPAVSETMTDRQLFEVLGRMTGELRDGHVNLTAAHDVARYGAWFDDYPANFADSLARRYLGRSEEYQVAAGLKYRILPDHIGYLRCESFEFLFGDGNLHEVFTHLAPCTGLIVDVRNNGGGLLTAAEKLASAFINERTLGGYIAHKTGPDHAALSTPAPLYLDPLPALRWQKGVCILTNRRTYSAANTFVMYLKGLPRVTIVGDRTGGGSGMPFSSELPCGWSIRFSASPLYDRQRACTEEGIAPDVKVDITSADYQRSVDTIIETARALLLNPATSRE